MSIDYFVGAGCMSNIHMYITTHVQHALALQVDQRTHAHHTMPGHCGPLPSKQTPHRVFFPISDEGSESQQDPSCYAVPALDGAHRRLVLLHACHHVGQGVLEQPSFAAENFKRSVWCPVLPGPHGLLVILWYIARQSPCLVAFTSLGADQPTQGVLLCAFARTLRHLRASLARSRRHCARVLHTGPAACSCC
jgi:hypothetical protein